MKRFLTTGLTFCCSCVAAFAQDSLKAKTLQEVVVTGQFEPQSAEKSVYRIRTIPMEVIQARGAVKLQDVLNTELNIRFSQDLSLGGSNISMQGLAGQNVKILIDGVPMIGRQGTTNEININQININSIERIEIVEGPMSVVYGSDALAGVINIITKKSGEGKLDATVKIQEETVGKEYSLKEGIHNETVGVGYAINKFHFRTDLTRNYFGGWTGDSTGREKTWHPKTQYLASGLAGFRGQRTNIYYRLDYLNEDIYNPGNYQGNEAKDQDYITNRFMHQVQGTHEFSEKLNTNLMVAYSDYQRKTQTVTVNKTTGDVRLSLGEGEQDLTRFRGLTIRNPYQYKISNVLSLQPGVDINYETGSGGRIKTGTQSIGDYALFLSGEWKISRSVQMRAGARSIYNTVYSAPPVVPSFNFKIRLSENNDLRLSYGRGFRAPSLRELYFNFFDASHSIEGNPNLKAELSHSINASWTSRMVKEDGHSYVSVVGSFYNSVNNMIGYGQLPGNPLITSYINIDRYKTEGLTWTNTLKWKHLDISAGAGYTGRYNQLAESSNDVNEFCWSPEVTSNVNYRIPKYSLSVAFYYKYTGRLPYYQIDPATNQAMLAKISPYNWADLTVQKSFLQHWNLSVGARNLLNIVSVNNSSGIAPSAHGTGGAQPIAYGRSYFFSISYSLNKL